MAKKMSVEEVLAAARAGKAQAGGAAPAKSETPATPEPPPAAAAVESTGVESTVAETPAAKPAAPAKVAPGGKGMSMADILAAARAGKAGAPVAEKAAQPAVSEKPAKAAVAEKSAPKPAVAIKSAAGGASKPAAEGAALAPNNTASILAAARKGTKPGPMSKSEAAALSQPTQPGGKKKLDVPPLPPKPDYARPRAATTVTDASRRSFMASAAGMLFGSSLAIGFTSLAATHLMWLLGLARFMFPNILIEPPTLFKVGFPDQLAPGQVETKYIAQFGVWIVKYEFEGQPMIYALKSVCTHLGCTPNWLEAEQKFKCPCHGSGFYKDGVNFEGPAPRPLERYAVSMADDGQLLVDKSRTFQEEMGQWKDVASFVNV